MQRFIDQHGRGAFLRRLDVSALLPSINYIPETLKLNNELILTGKNTPELPTKITYIPTVTQHLLLVVKTGLQLITYPSHLHGEPTSCG